MCRSPLMLLQRPGPLDLYSATVCRLPQNPRSMVSSVPFITSFSPVASSGTSKTAGPSRACSTLKKLGSSWLSSLPQRSGSCIHIAERWTQRLPVGISRPWSSAIWRPPDRNAFSLSPMLVILMGTMSQMPSGSRATG